MVSTFLTRKLTLLLSVLPVFLSITSTNAYTSYANDFVNPDFIIAGDFGEHTVAARNTIISWATETALLGPWSVMDKPFPPPTGDHHDYLSWAPYWWPDCSNVGNTTEIPTEEIWTTCPYESRDGLFNPDARLVNDIGNFEELSNAVLYNAIAWGVTKTDKFAEHTTRFINAWFLDEATRMNPHLDFGQVQRGPNNEGGSHTGILDLKGMVKIVSGILILRKGASPAWTTEMDNAMNTWVAQYANWLETKDIAIEEALADNNHGTFYYNQLAALKILIGDFAGAKNVTDTYFNTLYMSQIVRGGEQPLEAARTRPYHYRAYNLAAMITNARLAEYADPNAPVWNKPTNEGATIKDALDFAMTISASASKEDNYAAELYPNIAAVAAIYGDSDGKYQKYMENADLSFAEEPYYLWNQPWAISAGLAVKVQTPNNSNDGNSGNTNNNGNIIKNVNENSGVSIRTMSSGFVGLLFIVCYLLI